MAERPKNSDKFSDYVNLYYQQLTGITGSSSAQPIAFPDLPAPKQKLGFLGRFVDILSRPMRIISNPAMKIVELPERMDKVKELRLSGQDAAATKENLNVIGSLLASPFTGFFSDDPANKPYWSDIIEKQSDVKNRNDPNYVDVANNVGTKAKGGLGFVLDVAVDPLWLVPFLWPAKAAQTAVATTRGISTAAKTGVPGAVDVVSITNPNLRAFGSKESFNLITTTNGVTKTTAFSSRQAAQESLNKLASRKGSRPWVEAGSKDKAFRGTNTYRIVSQLPHPGKIPAAQATQKISDDLVEAATKGSATTSETITKSLRELVENAKTTIKGKPALLKPEINSFFESLAKTVPAIKTKPGAALPFAKWSSSLMENKTLLNQKIIVPDDTIFAASGLTKTSSIRHILDLAKNTRDIQLKDAINTRILRPAYEKYAAGVKAGKSVDLFGNATTPTARIQEAVEASVAATIVRNLKNLDEAERARGAALLGDDLFAELQTFNPKAMNKFLDDIDVVLKDTGALDAMASINPQSLLARFLGLFTSDPIKKAAAEAQLTKNINNIPNATPENTAARVVANSRLASVDDFIAERLKATAAPASGPLENVPNRIIAIKEVVGKVAKLWAKNQLDKKYQKGVYPHELNNPLKTLKTDAEFGVGRAVNPKDWNADAQASALRDIMIELNRFYQTNSGSSVFLGKKTGAAFQGLKFIKEKERDALVALELFEELFKAQGLAPVFRLDGVTHQMAFSQAWRIVSETMFSAQNVGNKWLSASLFNAFSPIGQKGSKLFDAVMPPQVFAYAVARGIETGDKAQVLSILMSKKSPANVDIINGLADSAVKGRNVKTGPGPGLPAKEMIDKIAEGIILAREALIKNGIVKNADEYVERGLVEGKQLSAEGAEFILDALNDPVGGARAIRLLVNPAKIIDDFTAVVPTTELGQTIAKGVLETGVGSNVSRTAQLTENLASAVASGNPQKVAKAQAAFVDDATRSVRELMDEAEKVARQMKDELADDLKTMVDSNKARPLDGIATEGYGTVTATILKFVDPLRRIFDGKYGMHTKELLWGSRLFYAIMNNMAFVNKPFLKSLKKIMNTKEFMEPVIPGGPIAIRQAVNNIQKGIISPEGTVLRRAEDSARPMLARFFDMTDEAQNVLLGSPLFRTGAGRQAINETLDYNQILGKTSEGVAKTPPRGAFFDEDLAFITASEKAILNSKNAKAKPSDDEILKELLDQWKTWDIEDPLDFMYKVNRAMVQLSAEVGFVTAFKQKAITYGVGSFGAQKGFVKIVPESDSRYGKLLGDEPFYMHPDAAEMFQAIDNLAKSTKQFEGGFGKFVKTVVDPVTDTWKYAITLPRLGHHIRNQVGDMTLTYLAEGIFGSAAALPKTIRLMAYKGNYPDIDMMKAMSYNGLTDIPKDSTIMSSGKFGQLSAAEIWQELIVKRGILIPARQSEGLFKARGFSPEQGIMDDMTANLLSRTLEKGLAVSTVGLAARGGRVENFWMGLSEGRDSLVRIHHAMQMMEKAQAGKILTRGYGQRVKPQTREELFDLIAERVSKYHPDMSTLSVIEKKYFRRLMPFYHWNRGAIQAVTETLLMNPGRVVALNKASYNIAVAAGINPDSMFDPFPDDQLFPSFLKQQMEGPQFEFDGSYFGVRPGIATFDVMNQFASGNPLDTLLDNANPAFKIPIELLTGTRLGTQSRIRDYSDYIDSNIPGINYVANISGKSVTGSFYSLLTGGGFDQQLQFELGNKGSREQFISALNWLLGIGLTDYSRPNYIRFAEIEQQQKNREQRGF